MVDESTYDSLGKLTEEMYLSLAKYQKVQMQDQIIEYHSFAEQKIANIVEDMELCKSGEILEECKKKMHIMYDDFCYMKNDINSKYKIYLRGCGNAGKSTLLNALLSLDEETGSRMGRLPMTFIVDVYTDELSTDEAEVRTISRDGQGKYSKTKRAKAIQMEDEEERKFFASKEKCKIEIEKRCEGVFLEQEREDIEREVYLSKLFKTSIREIKWGIGENNFFHNCILIDTPGLSQELRFTNVIEDVKNYEVDGIIWVISSQALEKQEVIDAYQKEMQEMQEIYDRKKIVAVINMYGEGSDYFYGSRLWKRVEKKARKTYCGQFGFNDVICVNAKLAYEGNLKNCQEDIEKSNIAELRKIINEMFVEKSTETYYSDKVDKIDGFLSNLYKESAIFKGRLQEKLEEYDDKHNKIINQVNACNNLVREARDTLVKRHLIDIKRRITNNSECVQTLSSRNPNERNRYVRNNIVCLDNVQRDITKMLEENAKKVHDRFCDLQVRSIISGFKTTDYAVRHFKNNTTAIAIRSKDNVPSFQYKMSGWDITSDVIKELFGNNDITRAIGGFFEGIRNAIKSPQDRLYDSVKKELIQWSKQLNLTEIISEYENVCMKTLDESMKQACGDYEEISELIQKINTFNSDKPQMTWKKIGLNNLIGELLDE